MNVYVVMRTSQSIDYESGSLDTTKDVEFVTLDKDIAYQFVAASDRDPSSFLTPIFTVKEMTLR
jgi:hypothetical protein